MSTVSDGIRPGGPCKHPDTYRCRESCECLCVSCWNKRHVSQVESVTGLDYADALALGAEQERLRQERIKAAGYCCEAGAVAAPGPCPWHPEPK